MAALDYIRKRWGVPTHTYENPLTDTVGTTATRIAPNNPDRFQLLIMNLGSYTIYVGLEPDVSSTKGIALAPNGGYLILTVEEDAVLVIREFWAIADGGESKIYVQSVEAIRK